MNLDAALPTFRLDRGTTIAQANLSNNSPITLGSPALDVMTDLTKVKAATTHPATTLRHAEQMMIYQGVRMLFVVDEMPSIEGLIAAADLRGDKQMRVVQERNLRYDDLCVADVMTALEALDAVDYHRVKAAAVGNAIATLKNWAETTCSSSRAPRRKHPAVCEASSRWLDGTAGGHSHRHRPHRQQLLGNRTGTCLTLRSAQ